jgi:hypothetical protein
MTDFDPVSVGFRWFIRRENGELPNDCDPIRSYLFEFAQRLPYRGARGNRVLTEMEDHLREVASELERHGIQSAAAAQESVDRFGTQADLLREFAHQAPFENEVLKMARIILTPVLALTTLFAGLIFLFAWFDDASTAALAMKVFLSVVVIGYNLILLHHLWAAKTTAAWEHWLVVGAALTSILMGAAMFVWSVHLGLVTGDWDGYIFVGATLLVLQGVLATFNVLISPSQQRAQLA